MATTATKKTTPAKKPAAKKTTPKPPPRSTPASVAAEESAAHHTQFNSNVHLDLIDVHPKNVRRDAVADEELVESIRAQGLVQPLVVAPHPAEADRWLLIAGHRRRDGALRAGHTTVPVIIRMDLVDEADQIAAMLVENGRRKDLTPMEEAAGYGQLRFDFNWKPGEIAKAAGHSVDTINRRLKLLKLDGKVAGKVDEGQVTIEEAIAVAELPKVEQGKLARSAGTSSFKWELSQAQDRVKKRAAAQKRIQQLEGSGVERLKLPAGMSTTWGVNHAEHGMTRLGATFSTQESDHPDCLAFVVLKGHGDVEQVELVCTNVPGHDEQLDAERAAKRQAEEQASAAAAETARAREIARGLRIDVLMEAIAKPNLKLDPLLVELLRLAIRTLLLNTSDYWGGQRRADVFFDALSVPEESRWSVSGLWEAGDVERFRQRVDDAGARDVVRLFLATTLSYLEGEDVVDAWAGNFAAATLKPREGAVTVRRYLELAVAAGHSLTPVDEEILDIIDGADQAAEAKP